MTSNDSAWRQLSDVVGSMIRQLDPAATTTEKKNAGDQGTKVAAGR